MPPHGPFTSGAALELIDASLDSLPNQRIVLRDVSWATFEALLQSLDASKQHLRVAFEEGTLELTTNSREHEQGKSILARMLELLTFERHIPIASYGSTTLRRRDLRRAVEPDECYYITKEPAVRASTDCNLLRDPPPDLALEVDITSTSFRRLRVYAKLGVGEVWRWTSGKITVYLRQPNGEYHEGDQSRLFPWLPMTQLATLLKRRTEVDETSLMHEFLGWLRALPPA